MADFEGLAEGVIKGEIDRVADLTRKAVDEGTDPMDIINKGLMSGMNVVGERFKAGEMFVPEVLMSAKAMTAGMEIVKPLIVGGGLPSKGKVILGTVKGDLHDIGKKLVGMIMESAGIEVQDLGTDIAPEVFAEAIKKEGPDVIGMSALLTTTMLSMKDTIEVLEEEGIRGKVKVIVGGAPVTKDFADEIGADGWAPDAVSAKDLVLQLMENK
ncbi:MAG: cobalamin-binding protein [Thermoplasmata archaeon]|nr:MAG: cobalamin-binding protein [Thermoplasmata archaeon]